MPESQTNINLSDCGEPPLHNEVFRWTMDEDTGVVTAVKPDGQKVRSEVELEDRRNRASRKVATHTLSWKQITEIAVHSKNAFHFIWRINRTAIA